ncbi:MAG: DUF4381 domain-containing protein [Dokdonella sp.]
MSAAPLASIPGPVLRDIHLPPPPSWWPPAPGWWLLSALVCVLLFFALRWVLQWTRERRWRGQIHAELDRIAALYAAQTEVAQLAAHVSQLLRRASRLIEPNAVALRGDAWLAFLDAQLPRERAQEAPFQTGAGRALIDAPYKRADDPASQAFERSALLDLARHWLSAALPRSHNHV